MATFKRLKKRFDGEKAKNNKKDELNDIVVSDEK